MDSKIVNCDNQSNIIIFEDPMLHGRAKNINIKYQYIRILVQDGVVKL